MFAIVRTGGKQYRVAAGDKIAVEKLAGEAGDTITFDDILFAGDGDGSKDAKGLTVSAEIIAQERGEKIIVFKKKRRHNYRRKAGHRQRLTLLKITGVGSEKAKTATAKKADAEQSGQKTAESKATEGENRRCKTGRQGHRNEAAGCQDRQGETRSQGRRRDKGRWRKRPRRRKPVLRKRAHRAKIRLTRPTENRILNEEARASVVG